MWGLTAKAGLPPTTSKLSSDSVDVTTFKYRFPNFTGTHSGTIVSLDINSLAGGGTNKNMTAVNGGIVYTDADSQEVSAAGTVGQYLISGGAAAPTWTTVSGTTQVATLRDEKTNGTAGGGFTSGSYQTRTLNTEVDPSSIVTLSSNQFTLAAGTYYLSASAPAHDVNGHKIKIRNITDSTDTLTGSKTISNATAGSNDNSVIEGIFTIAGTKVFELQHRCNTTRASDGFGQAASYSDTEVYSQVTIIKL